MKKFYTLPYLVAIFLFSLSAINVNAQEFNPGNVHFLNVNPLMEPFYHGVASGDPLSDRVILWTRVTPDSGSAGTIIVEWEISTDTNFTLVNSGTVATDASKDYTVKVDAAGLLPSTVYYYRFTALGKNSVIGRTKTTPVGDVDSLRFAVVSCANYEAGYFNAYSAINKANDVDAVIMLGDYIYEYETGGYGQGGSGRVWEPANEINSLTDYCTRYSHYHLDRDLRQLHQQYPWIIVWDDHETANDSWEGGAENHDTTEGNWFARKDRGIEAHHLWLPTRTFDTDTHRIYRTFSYGNLLDLIMLDTRLEGRNAKVNSTFSISGYPVVDVNDAALNDTSRKIMSQKQYEWLMGNMDTTAAQWKMLGQQVMIGPLRIKPFPFPPTTYAANIDQWDGFPAQRQRFFDDVLSKNIDNLVILTGDIHTSWANDLPYVSGTPYDNSNTNAVLGSAAVEFVGTSVTSPGLPSALSSIVTPTTAKNNNPNIRYVELEKKGYVIMDVNKTRTQGDFYYVQTIDSVNSNSYFETAWFVNAGERFLRQSTTATLASASITAIPFAPQEPLYVSIPEKANDDLLIFGIYPNPVSDFAIIQFYSEKAGIFRITLKDITGKTVTAENLETTSGLHLHGLDLTKVPAGMYFLSVDSKGYSVTQKLVISR